MGVKREKAVREHSVSMNFQERRSDIHAAAHFSCTCLQSAATPVDGTWQPGWVSSSSSSRTAFLKTAPFQQFGTFCCHFPYPFPPCSGLGFPGIRDCQRCNANPAALPTPPSSTPSKGVFQRLPKEKNTHITARAFPEPSHSSQQRNSGKGM